MLMVQLMITHSILHQQKALTFGTGGVDDAEDAGIIAHEYGHSIQDNQVPGFGSSAEGGAMGERIWGTS